MFRKESKINQELKSVIDMTIKKFLDDDSQKGNLNQFITF